MNDTYLKYIVTSEVLQPGPSAGDTRLQHVSVVSVVDENGEEWFPDPSIPIAIITEAYYDPSNVYTWGSTVKAMTATFVGDEDEQPLDIWARWQYKAIGENNYVDGPRFSGLDNKPTEITGVIPANTEKVKFFTSCKEKGDTPETSEFASSVLGVQDVLQPEVTVVDVTPRGSTALATDLRTTFEVFATGNYNLEYLWEFKEKTGGFTEAQSNQVERAYPDCYFSYFHIQGGTRFTLTWVDGAPGPTEFRCTVRDVYSNDVFDQVTIPTITVTYPDAITP